MKRILHIVAAFLLVASGSVFGQTLSVELDTGDLLSGDDFTLEATPSIEYALGDTGGSLAFSYTLPLLPDFTPGPFCLDETYSLDIGALGLTFANENNLFLGDDVSFDGTFTVEGSWAILALGADFAYLPDFEIDAYLTAEYQREIGPGTLDMAVTLYMEGDLTLGDLEGAIAYTVPTGPVDLCFELDPVLYGVTDGFGLSLALSTSYSF